MSKSRVAVISCSSYEDSKVMEALESGIQALGGWESFFAKEEEILLKPNLLAKAPPEKCVTTHPAVFEGVIRSMQQGGYHRISYGDSPGNPVIGTEKTAESCGLKEAAIRNHVPLADFHEGVLTTFEAGTHTKSFILAKGVLEADAILNICKMKTHQLERITGAVKNTFGCVYGINKMAFHAKCPDAMSFARMLSDLNLLVKPRLHIMDGIMAMEGNGPQSGTPAAMNVLLLSSDPVALDTVFSLLIGLDPALVPTNVIGEAMGVGQGRLENIEIHDGQRILSKEEAFDRFGKSDFDVYRGTTEETQIRLLRPIEGFLKKRPVIDRDKCVRCGICVDSCPIGQDALKFPGGKPGKRVPVYNYKHCIRCYCCQEMCPKDAIWVKTPAITRFLDRNWKL